MDSDAKGQLAERISNATNILITVSRNPSVDALAAALGLTLMLNKQDKHATAVFSGDMPPAISFLEPDKTFENTVNGLRDFIIALDKDKADRLRFKTDDDVVRIFVTPYRTTISEKDLQFSQGDFNVELIIALGVEKREDLDTAITAHGRILHDATVATINTKEEENTLGALDWQAPKASGLSEMIADLQSSLGDNLMDEQIATALMTGLVAVTNRFSNESTNSRTMSLAAQLMSAGANQQLIAAKLDEKQPIPEAEAGRGVKLERPGQTGQMQPKGAPTEETAKAQTPPQEETQEKEATPDKRDVEMRIDHAAEKKAKSQQPPAKQQNVPQGGKKPQQPPQGGKGQQPQKQKQQKQPQPQQQPEQEKPQKQPSQQPTSQGQQAPPKGVSVEDLKRDLAATSQEIEEAAGGTDKQDEAAHPKIEPIKRGSQQEETETPKLGGTLNATTEQAAEQKKKQEADERNRTVLTHDKPAMGQPSQPQTPFNAYAPGASQAEPASVDPFGQKPPTGEQATGSNQQNEQSAPAQQQQGTSSQGGAAPSVDSARQDVEAALESAPFDPAHHPEQRTGAQSLPPLHNDNAPQQQPSGQPQASPQVQQQMQNQGQGQQQQGQPQQPQQADSSQLPPMPPMEEMPLPPPPPPPDTSQLPPMPPSQSQAVQGQQQQGQPPQAPASPQQQAQQAQSSQPSQDSAAPPPPPPVAPVSNQNTNDPGQFKIPGQQ